MLFNSLIFISVFLPLAFFIYFFLNKKKFFNSARAWLLFSSLFFYGWWNFYYLPLILLSIVANYSVGHFLGKENPKFNRKIILTAGLFFNIGLLGYFKYSNFFIENLNRTFSLDISLLNLVLPLAISFFTFQQIAYLVDAYKKETKEYSFLDYANLVAFFPHLIAGPIVYYKELAPQFKDRQRMTINYQNLVWGIFIFSIGLAKKVLIADTFSIWAKEGFDNGDILNFTEAWITSLSYTLQLYFDFSGYADMAIGAALMFNIKLPINFNSPYKSLNIQDFWRRWHITLGRFLTSYLYIPLGGSRGSQLRTGVNVMIVFLLSGFWHGAGWTFIFWGFLHGAATVISKVWSGFRLRINPLVSWFITFNFVNFAWVFFRAKNWDDATRVLKGMFGFNGLALPRSLASNLGFLKDYGVEFSAINLQDGKKAILMLLVFIFAAIFLKNSNQLMENFKPNKKYLILTIFLMSAAVIYVIFSKERSEFLYFNF